jgi:hypothetical protein
VSKITIRKASLADVPDIACNLLPDDHREIVEGAGLNPVLSISLDMQFSHSVVFYTKDHGFLGIAGVSTDGCIWMHCTPAVKEIPLLFCREARRWLNGLQHPILFNCADIRNTTHLKLLKHLGFKFLRLIPFGPNNLYFVEFVRLWYSPSPQ